MNRQAAFVAVVLAWATCGVAQELQFPEHNCALTRVQGWEPMSNPPAQPGLVVLYIHAPTGRSFGLMMDLKHGSPAKMDENYIAEVEKGFAQNGAKRISGGYVTVGGVKAYERLGRLSRGEESASVLTVLVPTVNKNYILVGASRDGDAGRDAEIREWIAGFRFLSPPSQTPARSQPGSAASRVGYLFGQLTGVALIAGLVVLAIRAVTRRKDAQGGSKPPPLPPPAVGQ